MFEENKETKKKEKKMKIRNEKSFIFRIQTWLRYTRSGKTNQGPILKNFQDLNQFNVVVG